MVGTVPIYQVTVETIKKRGAVVEMTKEDLFDVIRQQAADGADFMTIHCGRGEPRRQLYYRLDAA